MHINSLPWIFLEKVHYWHLNEIACLSSISVLLECGHLFQISHSIFTLTEDQMMFSQLQQAEIYLVTYMLIIVENWH